MTIPGVGQLTALAFVAAIDDPSRIRRSRDVGAYLGLVPRRYQSGEVDYTGGISKCGDRRVRTLLYEAANVMLTRYKGQLKLKDWAFAIAKRSTMRKARSRSGSPPRDHHARDAARRDGVRVGLSPQDPRDRRPNPAPTRSDARGREQTTARILLQRPTTGRLRFQPSRPAPSLPHQVPNEHAENAGTRKRRHPEELRLDPLENNIRKQWTFRTLRERPKSKNCTVILPRNCGAFQSRATYAYRNARVCFFGRMEILAWA